MRTGSVVVTERTTQNIPGLKSVSESIYQTVFLGIQWCGQAKSSLNNEFLIPGLKIFIVAFEKRLSAEWSKMAKCIRELGQKHAGTKYMQLTLTGYV